MTRDGKIYRLAYWMACGVLAMVLLSGYYKILYPDEFAVSVYRFHLLPGVLINLTAIYLPWLEVVCAVCLLAVPRLRPAALWIVLGMLVVFTLAIGISLWRGSTFGCGCFGRGANDDPLSWMHIVRNIGLILLALLALAAKKRSRQDAAGVSGA